MSEIRNIVIVDDREENRVAAAAGIVKVLPSANVRMYPSAAEFISSLGDNPTDDIDIVLSDMKMEDENAGRRVAIAAWSWNIPTVIVSGGGKDHGRSYIVVSFPLCGRIFGEKDQPQVWSDILFQVLKNGTIQRAVRWGKRITPDTEYGETCASTLLTLAPFL